MPEQLKREHEDSEPEELTAGFVCYLIQRMTGQSVGEFISDMVKKEVLTPEEVEELTDRLPSLPKSEWEKVALEFDLNPTMDKYQLQPFSIPHAYLPPSFHKRVMRNSIQWLDVYQERGSSKRDAAHVRLMDAWHVPVCALFKGRMVDMLENPMLDTSKISTGDVQHEVHMLQGIILLVVELKLALKTERDHVAQVMSELSSAYEINKANEFEPQPPVYAVLTDLKDFYFFSYDGSTFKMDTEIWVSSESRAHFFHGMAEVMERLFSILLQGFISTLNAAVERPKKCGIIKNVSQPNSIQSRQLNSRKPVAVMSSPDNWIKAVTKAQEAQTILVDCDRSSLKTWEDAGQQGLHRLEESVSYLVKIGSLTDWDQQQAEHEIHGILSSMCKMHK